MNGEEQQKRVQDNVAIFVDYDNVYWTLMKNYKHDPDHEDPEKNLFIKLWKRYGKDNVRTFRVYADFQKIRTSLTSLQQKRIQIRHVYSNGERKNSSDIELCIDAIETTYRDSTITCYVFVTADSDMIPILSRMMYKGKRVELFYIKDAAPKYVDITSYAHYSEDLLDFLNVEREVKHNLDDFIEEALKYIDEWHKNNGNYPNKFLGRKWLSEGLIDKLVIPPDVCAELIDKLKLDGYIVEEPKRLDNGKERIEFRLTSKAYDLLYHHSLSR
ncbi:MAG: NYN domain-containing protein [Clostridia bacterium]